MPDVAAALHRAAEAGPYFAVSTDASGPGWLPFTDLLDDPACLAARVDVVRDALSASAAAPVERRVAASIHFLALASRLVAPALATAALDGVVPSWTPGSLSWQPVAGGPVPLLTRDTSGTSVGDVAEAAAAVHEHVVDTVVAPLVTAFGSVSPTVLWGNVASAAVGAGRMLPAVLPVAAALLEHGPLRGTGAFDGPAFRRASCCLFYRVPGGGYCGDCVLA